MKREISIQSDQGTPLNDNLQAWLTANGISPRATPISAVATVDEDAKELTIEQFVLNDDWTKVIDYPHGEPEARKTTVTVPLLSAPEDHNL